MIVFVVGNADVSHLQHLQQIVTPAGCRNIPPPAAIQDAMEKQKRAELEKIEAVTRIITATIIIPTIPGILKILPEFKYYLSTLHFHQEHGAQQ